MSSARAKVDMRFEIRSALVDDAAGIRRLAEELGYPATGPDMARRLAELLALPNHYVVVAEAGEQLLGWAAVEIRILLVSGRKAELTGLVVTADARQHGIGRALVRHVERWVVEQGLDRLTVRSNIVRAQSHPFYLQLGYCRSKSQHVYVKTLTQLWNLSRNHP